jgi:hypothetical protein
MPSEVSQDQINLSDSEHSFPDSGSGFLPMVVLFVNFDLCPVSEGKIGF